MIWEREDGDLAQNYTYTHRTRVKRGGNCHTEDGSVGRALGSFLVCWVNISPYALPICPLTFLSIYACLSVYLSVYHLSNYSSTQSTHPTIHPSILHMYLHVNPICLSSIFYLPIYLSSIIYLHLSTYLSI